MAACPPNSNPGRYPVFAQRVGRLDQCYLVVSYRQADTLLVFSQPGPKNVLYKPYRAIGVGSKLRGQGGQDSVRYPVRQYVPQGR